ncbi:DNA-processing protein DprA [Pseudaestuariivita sp.]|uniref:DNA-processing protein DprA n=1 Tax=Pseudaestuariivita sp. TaxID=2211669 RepID=UPI004058478B
MTGTQVSSSHPPIPPTSEDDRITCLRLLRSRRVGPSTFYKLLAEHRTPRAALEALPDLAAKSGVSEYRVCPSGVVQAEMAAARRIGAHLIRWDGAGYPQPLEDISDAPPLLWVRGNAELLHRPMVALVGARNASSLGGRMARALAEGLAAQGFVVVSGLARGIDAIAHDAAGPENTIAVMPGGVDVLYPSENAALAETIAQKGLLLSEQPMGLAPMARHFPKRNRIISGLARAVIVVEAAARSGTLITARCALDQGREVLAVPGHPFDPRAGGCNMLIRDGAALVRSVDDVLEALGPASAPQVKPPAAANSPQQSPPQSRAAILDLLGPSPLAEDQLVRDLSVPSAALAPVLTELELEGLIERHPGGLISARSVEPVHTA